MITILSSGSGMANYAGLSTDTKPTASNGSSFLETDTTSFYFMVAGVWTEKFNVGYATSAQGTTATTALQPAGSGSALTGLTKTQVGLANVDNTSDANKPVSSATQTALNAKQASGSYATGTGTANGTNTGDQDLSALAPKASPTFTGTVTLPAGQALVTPNIGAATGTSLIVIGGLGSSGGGVGYVAGSGGTVTQLTSKATGVTLNKYCGTITTHNAALAAAAIVTFTVTDSVIAATDVVHAQHDSGGTVGAYTVMPNTSAAGSFKITLRNNTAGSLSEAIVIRFAVIKAVAA